LSDARIWSPAARDDEPGGVVKAGISRTDDVLSPDWVEAPPPRFGGSTRLRRHERGGQRGNLRRRNLLRRRGRLVPRVLNELCEGSSRNEPTWDS
jgi:hypothetical protein